MSLIEGVSLNYSTKKSDKLINTPYKEKRGKYNYIHVCTYIYNKEESTILPSVMAKWLYKISAETEKPLIE